MYIYSIFEMSIYKNFHKYRKISKNAQRILADLFSSQPPFTCSKSTIETLEQGGKYVQS